MDGPRAARAGWRSHRTVATKPPFEREAQAFADAAANPPFLYDLGPGKGRELVNQTPSGEVDLAGKATGRL